MAFKDNDQAKAYWSENLSLVIKLLAVWFVISFGCGILFVDALNEIRFFGFKLGFWFSQQGAIYTFVALIFVYVYKMAALDKKYGVDE
jgi:putative solute:sodium symporter small subunit